MDTLNEASIIMRIPAPTIIGGIKPAKAPACGKKNKAIDANRAPVRKKGLRRPKPFHVRSE